LFIPNFAGLCNRLEALMLARTLQAAYGGEIQLDWPELDALQVPFGQPGRPFWWKRRWGMKRLRNCDEAQFVAAGNLTSVELRGLHGPHERIRTIYLPTAGELRLRRDLKTAIEHMFQAIENRPVVGIHLRRGDFVAVTGDFDTTLPGPSQMLPIEWVEAAMQQCLAFWPSCVFFVSASQAEADCARLRRNFNLIQLPVENPYELSTPGHCASTHPVGDLFALACCQVIIATPISSFSHFAANALGPRTTCIIPPQKMRPGEKPLCRVDMYGQLLSDWIRVFRQPNITRPFDVGVLQDHASPSALTDWIPAFDL
ncbi:MAG: hypothetical protein WCJ07_13740, partial [Verrucomicrobiota bacterium]